jgi:threonine dehydrogenase-like Zn-dependent dehydrogenase
MKAAQFIKPGCIDIVEVPRPAPKDKQVLIKMEGCGICGSNIPMWEGREWFNYPAEPGNPGHEGWGVVESVGQNVEEFSPGDRVTMLSYNAFAEYDIAEKSAVVKLPESDGLNFPGEPLGCAMNIFSRSNIKIGDVVAVIGIGFMGALITQLASKSGAEVISISRRQFSLDIAKKMGADYTIKMDDHWKIIDKVKNISKEALCTHVVEAVGLQWPLDLAGDIVREGGRLIIAGYHQDGLRKINMQQWNWKGIDIISAHERKQNKYIDGMKKAVNAVKKNILTPSELYSEFNFEDINKAFDTAVKRPDGFIKAVIRF